MAPESNRKVLLVELNEITWRLLKPLVAGGHLPTFARLMREGVRATPMAPEVSPDLDPWISWTTLFTGRPQSEHGVKFLEQPPETVHGPRLWEIAADAGKSIGVFGSTMSWPPRTNIKGFWVPGTFSPGPETFPANLQPIQDLNLTYTRAHTPVGDNGKKLSKVDLLLQLRGIGLRISTVFEIAGFFARRALGIAKDWEKVSLQPLINLDFFTKLWRENKPDFATFHSNHVAHYQHRYWRSTDPAPFLEKPTEAEIKNFGGCIKFGYQMADRLLASVLQMIDEQTVLVIASGLGQQPYVNETFRDGRTVLRMNDIQQVLELLDIKNDCEAFSVMAPQWNLKFKTPEGLAKAQAGFAAAYHKTPGQELFAATTVGDTMCVNLRQALPRPIDWSAECVFPTTNRRLAFKELAAEKDPTPKQGYHEQAGVLVAFGPQVARDVDIGECSTLDIAPTLLTVMGLPVPGYMTGRVIPEIAGTPNSIGQGKQLAGAAS